MLSVLCLCYTFQLVLEFIKFTYIDCDNIYLTYVSEKCKQKNRIFGFTFH